MLKLNHIRCLFICAVVVLFSFQVFSQTPAQNRDQSSPQSEQVRLKLTDGTYLAVDVAWETPQGIWYRQGGLSHLAPKDRVKSIVRGEEPPPKTKAKTKEKLSDGPLYMAPVFAEPEPAKTESGVFDKPAWIYLKGGAKVEADSATESAAGVWYKRASMSIFIERSRIDRIELEDVAKSDPGKKERGWSTGSSRLDALIRQNGMRYRVDPYLIFLVMEQESHFNSRVVSPKGAMGLIQLMPGTAARFGVRRSFDPAQNVSAGTRYLRELLNRFNNRVDLVLASYNAGEGAVIKFGHQVPPYKETRNYVKQISYRYRRNAVKPKKASASEAATTSGEK
jgi:soluble lytic murein transglycosylase-like protein